MVKKWWYCVLMLVGGCRILTGCSTTELEERCFPMTVFIGYEDGSFTYGAEFTKDGENGTSKGTLAKNSNFSKAKSGYENRLNKEADYNHLKVFVIEEDLLEQKNAYEEMLEDLAQTEEFPRNTYVCVVDEVDDLFELQKNISQDIGTYVEEYLKKQEEKKNRLLTLGDLIDEKENHAMVLYLPYLEVEENFIEWKGYMNTSGKVWKDSY